MVSVLEGWNIPIVCMHAAIKLKQISCTIGTMRPTQKLPQPCSLLGFFSSSLASLLSPTPSVHALPSLLAFHFLPYSSYPCWLSFLVLGFLPWRIRWRWVGIRTFLFLVLVLVAFLCFLLPRVLLFFLLILSWWSVMHLYNTSMTWRDTIAMVWNGVSLGMVKPSVWTT